MMKNRFVQLAMALFLFDTAVKQEVEASPEFETERSLAGGKIRLQKLYNYGTAGSRLVGHMPAIIAGSGLLVFGSLAYFLRLLQKNGRTLQKLGFSFLLGGALSNLYDRCKKGYVVDYIRFETRWKRLSRLVFNLSDFFIFAGIFFICAEETDREQG